MQRRVGDTLQHASLKKCNVEKRLPSAKDDGRNTKRHVSQLDRNHRVVALHEVYFPPALTVAEVESLVRTT